MFPGLEKQSENFNECQPIPRARKTSRDDLIGSHASAPPPLNSAVTRQFTYEEILEQLRDLGRSGWWHGLDFQCCRPRKELSDP
jgi:hypothetical protein